MTTHSSESTTKPHWSDETADAAVQAAIEARALMLATARALGLADEDVERAPQRAAGLVKEVENLHMWLEQSQTEYNVSLIASLCQDCAKHPNRHSHGGTHCRWCGRSTVAKEGEERQTYAELRARLIEITRRDAATCTRLAQAEARMRSLVPEAWLLRWAAGMVNYLVHIHPTDNDDWALKWIQRLYDLAARIKVMAAEEDG